MSCQPIGKKAWTDPRFQYVTSKKNGSFHFSPSLAPFFKAQGPVMEEGAHQTVRTEGGVIVRSQQIWAGLSFGQHDCMCRPFQLDLRLWGTTKFPV